MKQVDLKALFRYFDVSGEGRVCYNEFVEALCDKNVTRRKVEIVEVAWSVLDPLNSGFCTGKQMLECLANQEEKSILDKFAGTAGGNQEGKVTKDEFRNYYIEVSTAIPSDDYFVKKLESTWRGVKEVGEVKVDKKLIMTKIAHMRQRLLTLSKGKQEEYILRDIFRSYDVDNSGALSLIELAGLMSKLGVDFTQTQLYAVMRELDVNNSGVIEFEEFCQFLLYNPYK